MKRDEEEKAAYFAWKRGETPLGTTPNYIPPEPTTPRATGEANADVPSKLSDEITARIHGAGEAVGEQGGQGVRVGDGIAVKEIDSAAGTAATAGFSEGVVTASANAPGGQTLRKETEKALHEVQRDPTIGQTGHLFDDPLFAGTTDSSPPASEVGREPSDHVTGPGSGEGGYDIRSVEKSVDIDEVDLDDPSPEGRELRMKAMADELSSFSASQMAEAERAEAERVKRGIEAGRKIMDHFGQRFEEAPPTRGRGRR